MMGVKDCRNVHVTRMNRRTMGLHSAFAEHLPIIAGVYYECILTESTFLKKFYPRPESFYVLVNA